MSSDAVFAPWTSKETLALIKRQNDNRNHPYTCEHGHGRLGVTRDFMFCDQCEYRQEWAHRGDLK